jgi:hypothetical protein
MFNIACASKNQGLMETMSTSMSMSMASQVQQGVEYMDARTACAAA